MPEAVTSFISGAVPAVALWVPFNITVRDKVPGARKLVDASAYYPQAAIVGGWAARNDFYDQEPRGAARAWSRPGSRPTTNHRANPTRRSTIAAEEAIQAGAARRLQGAVRGAEGVHRRPSGASSTPTAR